MYPVNPNEAGRQSLLRDIFHLPHCQPDHGPQTRGTTRHPDSHSHIHTGARLYKPNRLIIKHTTHPTLSPYRLIGTSYSRQAAHPQKEGVRESDRNEGERPVGTNPYPYRTLRPVPTGPSAPTPGGWENATPGSTGKAPPPPPP